MKKIIAVFAFMLAFTVSAQAQDKKTSPQSKGRQEAVELVDYLKLTSTDLENFTRLFQSKHEMLADPNVSAGKKKEISVIMEKKIEGSIDGNQLQKLQANKELWAKLTH
ncbi:hypothetical protein [Flavobacterium sp.]|uniref:hypothetical protein n=1 Tax=Flavobacterium sp. TaxID=239 RepID=UPI0012102A5A|nr:hypothetical protein [Flavobacterium sp.]RZJ73552.1 MAG: hypothetical protein EOO49_01690 [Flavobacterium sp.]